VVDGGGQCVEEPPEPAGSRAVMIMSAPHARARWAVSSPMPELPPITMTVCPRRSRPRGREEELIEAAVIPADLALAESVSLLRAGVPHRPRRHPGLPSGARDSQAQTVHLCSAHASGGG